MKNIPIVSAIAECESMIERTGKDFRVIDIVRHRQIRKAAETTLSFNGMPVQGEVGNLITTNPTGAVE